MLDVIIDGVSTPRFRFLKPIRGTDKSSISALYVESAVERSEVSPPLVISCLVFSSFSSVLMVDDPSAAYALSACAKFRACSRVDLFVGGIA